MCPPASAAPANATAANAAIIFILFMTWFLSLLAVMCLRQIEAPMSPPTSPPRSEAPISHQSSVWRVPLWRCFCSWCLSGGGGVGVWRTTSCLSSCFEWVAWCFAVSLAGAEAFAVCVFCADAFIAAGAWPLEGGFPFGAAIAVPQSAPHTASAITIFCIALFIVVFLSSSRKPILALTQR